MKENIEEDIKIVKKLLLHSESTLLDDESMAIEHILSDYKRVLKENEVAKEALKKQCNIADERNQLLKENEELKHKYDKALSDLVKAENETIPVQKVKDKTEELNEYYKKEVYLSLVNWKDIDITEYYDNMMDILQDLLEEKGE